MSPSLDIYPAVPINGNTNGVATNGLKKHQPALDGFGTRAIHVGSEPNEETGAVIPAISLSTTYKQSAIGVHKVSRSYHGRHSSVAMLF